jgi:predicted ATP-dependent serine protease
MTDPGPASLFLVGRDAELARIESAVADVAQQGGTVRIAGDPGVGKSALLRAGQELAVARGYTALSVHATEGEGADRGRRRADPGLCRS